MATWKRVITEADIGSTVQAYDADLTTWASTTPSTNGKALVSAADYAAMRTLLSIGTIGQQNTINGGNWAVGGTDLAIGNGGTGGSTASAARTNLGVAIGSDVQAYSAHLGTIAGLARTANNFIVGDGTNWTLKTASAARTSLGLPAKAVYNFTSPAGNTTDGYVYTYKHAVPPTVELIAQNSIGTSYSAGTGISLAGTTFSVDGGTGITANSGGVSIDYSGTDNFIDSATNLEGTGINQGDTVVYHDATDSIVKKGFVGDLPFSNNDGTVTRVKLTADSGSALDTTTTADWTIGGGTNCTTSTLSNTLTINVSDAFLKNNASDTTSGTITAAGFTTSGTVACGTLQVSGGIVDTTTEKLSVKDSMIILNSDYSGSAAIDGGFIVERDGTDGVNNSIGDEYDAIMMWDESNGRWRMTQSNDKTFPSTAAATGPGGQETAMGFVVGVTHNTSTPGSNEGTGIGHMHVKTDTNQVYIRTA